MASRTSDSGGLMAPKYVSVRSDGEGWYESTAPCYTYRTETTSSNYDNPYDAAETLWLSNLPIASSETVELVLRHARATNPVLSSKTETLTARPFATCWCPRLLELSASGLASVT